MNGEENNDSKKYYVFVYGTLMKGGMNHFLMQYHKAQFIDSATTSFHKFNMISIGEDFPGIVTGNGAIVGEVYMIDEKTLPVLDRLEGYPDFYNRIVIPVDGMTERKRYNAIVYVLSQKFLNNDSERIESDLIKAEDSENISVQGNVYKWLNLGGTHFSRTF